MKEGIVWVYLVGSYFQFIIASKFPPNFRFGLSTSSYQIEGAWNVDGKGENIWDKYTHREPYAIKNEDNGDIACDSYDLYKQDVKLLKDIGVDVYRFSISWSRILPNGQLTQISPPGIAYYNNLIDELLRNGIEPVVTIYHWDLPQKLQDIGGWLNSSIIEHMENYADLLFYLYGDRVKWWITINEPINVVHGYCLGYFAPGWTLRTPHDYTIVHNILRAHARIYRLYDKRYRSQQNGKVSIALNYDFCAPKTSDSQNIEAAERNFQFLIGIFAHPIYSKDGDYPELVREIVDTNSKQEGRNESRLPYFTKKEKNELLGSFDYFGFNHYSTYLCSSPLSSNNSRLPLTPFYQDTNVIQESDPKWPVSHAEWLKVVPWGFREALKQIKDEYNNPPILITENGYCDKGELNDTDRISYHQQYLTELLNAINTYNCKVFGYIAWAAMDNFEWASGYDNRFGMVHVDFKSAQRTRTLKSSAYFFKSLIKTRTLPTDSLNLN